MTTASRDVAKAQPDRLERVDRVDRPDRVPRVVVTGEGPILVEGPVEVVRPDGTFVRSERGVVALCTCRRSRIAPFCDTSHRDKVRAGDRDPACAVPDGDTGAHVPQDQS